MRAAELEDHAPSSEEQNQASKISGPHSCAAILVNDPTTQRLMESLSVQLELEPILFHDLTLTSDISEAIDQFTGCELIIAEAAIADLIRSAFTDREHQSEGVNPALIAVRYRRHEVLAKRDQKKQDGEPDSGQQQEDAHSFEAVLHLPQDPAIVLAQLSVALYAHRAFVRRYQSALEELHLNRRIFRSVTSGISVADATRPDMPLVYVNPAFEVMTGYSLEESLGRNCRFLQGPDRNQPALTLIREALASGREAVAVLKNYRKGGSPFWNELSISPIRNRDGKVSHIVGIQMDVTARVEFEAALRESEKLAAVGRLAASIAHEINNPLESVTNLIYLARHSDARPQIMHYLDQADTELQRASQITTQSLRFYRQSTKAQAIRPTDLLESVIDLYQGKLDNANIRVQRRERTTDSIVCLESEVRQVLTNLIRNAIDAMNGNGGRLLVRSREATQWRSGAQGVLITIADTGSGIPPDVMKNLYTAFFTTKGIGGTGLGLWVSAEIIKRHHGCLRVRSCHRPGRSWTVFELFLPYQGLGAE